MFANYVKIAFRTLLRNRSYALVSFITRQKTKEVGISFFIMQRWLDTFAYRAPMGIDIFIATVVGIQVVAWVSVGYRTLSTSIANPVEALRYE